MTAQQQRSEVTRRKLLKAFRNSFLKRGFEATTTQDVLAETGLSKGALYHHFQSKSDVMEAIYEEESRRAIGRAMRSVDEEAPYMTRLRAAFVAWTKEVRSPSTSKILFDIGPSALGRQRAKEIEDANSLLHVEKLLAAAVNAGEIETSQPALVAAMLNALAAEAALYNLRTGADASATLDAVLDSVFTSMSPQRHATAPDASPSRAR